MRMIYTINRLKLSFCVIFIVFCFLLFGLLSVCLLYKGLYGYKAYLVDFMSRKHG